MIEGVVPRPVAAGDVLPDQTELTFGAFGPGVAQLQHRLIALGHMSSDAIRVCEGMFGPRTGEAVAKVGPHNWKLIATEHLAGHGRSDVQIGRAHV